MMQNLYKKTYLLMGMLLLLCCLNKGWAQGVEKELFPNLQEHDNPIERMEFEKMMLIDPATGEIPDNIREKELKPV
ncbi:MAG TPA: hypothetical protein DCM08_12670 [Microscillaceae bacterium]|jgi:hypothetical protein|nr:hypothetical protein [Microscillaceae bacterium]